MRAIQLAWPRRRSALPALTAGLCLVLGLLLPAAPSPAAVEPPRREAAEAGGLSAADIERYRAIFAAQQAGNWAEADALVARLENDVLLGHVLAQRYLHPTHYRSRYRELADWLARYADHPDAPRIHRLALKRKPSGTAAPRRPVRAKTSLAAEAPLDAVYLYQSEKRLSRAERRKVQRLKRRIRNYVRRTYLTKTERLLEQAEVRRLFDRFELDEAYGLVAAAWFYYGKAEKAYELADAAAERSGAAIPTTHWTAGLSAWTLGRLGDAGRHFQRLASAEAASGWNRSAGAYWAARVHERRSDPAATHRWLTVAAGFPYTFYGLLARHRLHLRSDVSLAAVGPGEPALARLRAVPAGARAAALLAVGRDDLAEQELLALPDWREAATARALLVVTQSAGLPRLGLEVARRLLRDRASGWSRHDLAPVLYPVPVWRPAGGYTLDRALVYAFIRQESSFDPRARSPAGARGLMQLMPRTASALDRQTRYRGRSRDLLYDPARNLLLGQRYLARLLATRRVDGDLLRLAAAYNGGPGNLGKWQRQMGRIDDPLLFIESLPLLESRLFVERIMTNLWIYRHRLGQPAPSLAALAAGLWPTYEPLDHPAAQVATSP